jgi:ATP-dependent Lhr-like helicase
LQRNAAELGISDVQSEGCCYITFKCREEAGKRLLLALRDIVTREPLDTRSLVSEGECPVFDKYDEYIPPELLREAYAADRLFADEVVERFE